MINFYNLKINKTRGKDEELEAKAAKAESADLLTVYCTVIMVVP